MAEKCKHHPGRDSVNVINGKKYCSKCDEGQKKAGKSVDKHVVPKDCFVWYIGGDKWVPVKGTGCAHWVAHEKNITKGSSIHQCLKGFTIKVSDIAKGKTKVTSLDKVKVGDIYINPKKDHCGLVSKVTKVPGEDNVIEIEHDSSRQRKVAKNDFLKYFGGKGDFFR